jgi:hypothetical protein
MNGLARCNKVECKTGSWRPNPWRSRAEWFRPSKTWPGLKAAGADFHSITQLTYYIVNYQP